MSVKVSSMCWKVPLPGTEKLVLMRLADFADEHGFNIYPAVQTVAEDCGLGRRAAQLTLKKLVNLGILVVINQGGGRRRTTEYAIDMDLIQQLKDAPPSANGHCHGHFSNGENGANSEPRAPFNGEMGEKGARGSQNSAPDSPNPSLPVKEGGGGARAHEVGRQVAAKTGLPVEDCAARAAEWLATGYDPQADIYPMVDKLVTAAKHPIGTPQYFTAAIGRHHADRIAPPPNVTYLPAAGGRRGDDRMSRGAEDLLAAWNDPNFDYGLGTRR